MDDHELILAAMDAVLAHFDNHPGAADTLEGIHHFWLRSEERREITLAALELLAQAGSVEPVAGGDGRVRWYKR